MQQNKAVRERTFGKLEGLNVSEYAAALGERELAAELKTFSFRTVSKKDSRVGKLIEQVFSLSPPGGESTREFRERAENYYRVRNNTC